MKNDLDLIRPVQEVEDNKTDVGSIEEDTLKRPIVRPTLQRRETLLALEELKVSDNKKIDVDSIEEDTLKRPIVRPTSQRGAGASRATAIHQGRRKAPTTHPHTPDPYAMVPPHLTMTEVVGQRQHVEAS